MREAHKPPPAPPGRSNGGAGPHGHARQQWRSDEDSLARLAAYLVQRGASPRTCSAIIIAVVCTAAFMLLLLVLGPAAGGAAHAVLGGGGGVGGGSSSSDGGPEMMRPSSDRHGYCRLEYTVKTWDGRNARVCDPSICRGREKLKVLGPKAGSSSSRRWSAYHESTYMRMYNGGQISGWLKARQIAFVKAFTARQHELGLFGSVGEIGVHHGKFLIPLVGNALRSEPAVAIDLFEDQSANVDTSGRGSKSYLLRNLELAGIPEESITLLGGNSMLLSARNFTARGFPAFRMLSVDGGHTLEITLHDMMVASCLVRDGGIVILDDFPNAVWLGVAEALMHWVHAQDRLVPFLHGANKVWFTTPSHVAAYRALIEAHPKVFPCTKDHASKQTIAGYQLCWTGFN